MSFEQAAAYCRFARGRLPTEAEWEWAARGGPKGTEFPWGNEAPDGQLCWRCSDAQGTCSVRAFPAGDSPDGVKDLAGGVREWTSSKPGPGDQGEGARIKRGGGFREADAANVRARERFIYAEGERDPDLGFRCARSP